MALVQTFLPYMGFHFFVGRLHQDTQGGILAFFFFFNFVMVRFYSAYGDHSLLGTLLTGHERKVS